MISSKIVSLPQLKKHTATWKNQKVGLVTGCFDVLHFGHVNLFEFAKNHVDILLVGVESDQSVKLNKGENRPIFDQEVRQKVLGALSFIDYVFLIDHQLEFASKAIDDLYGDLYKQLRITHLFTHPQADRSHLAKAKRAKELNIEFVIQEGDKFLGSSTEIIDKLGL